MRLTDQGAERYNRLTTNRPKVIAKECTDVSDTAKTGGNNRMPTEKNAHRNCSEVNGAGTYTFECSEKLAKIYFPQFLAEAEIIAPQELRLWFKEQFEKTAGVYSSI